MPQAYYQKFYNDLRRRIVSGRYKPGDLLPSENSLAEQYSTTRITVRHALTLLVQEGYITKQKGKGSIVSLKRNTLALLTFKGFSESLGKMDIPVRTNELSRPKRQKWPKNFFYPLSNEELTHGCLFFQRLRFAADTPVMLEYTYLPTLITGYVVLNPLLENSLFATLRSRAGIEIVEVEQELKAIMPDDTTAEWLCVPNSMPIVHIYRRYRTSKPDFYIYSSLYCSTQKYSLGNIFE
jgi:DNA-binding GntR family transcriptional regulator